MIVIRSILPEVPESPGRQLRVPHGMLDILMAEVELDRACVKEYWEGVMPSAGIELLKALPSFVTALTAIYGLMLAKAGLEKWHQETIGKRKAELAEQILAGMYEARSIFQWARTPATLKGEGESRRAEEDECDKVKARRNMYYLRLACLWKWRRMSRA